MPHIGLQILRDKLEDYPRHLQEAEAMGIEKIAVGDSQSHSHDAWMRATLAGLNTERARIGTWCTNPLTRHPAVTAGALATLDDITGGRAFLGIGPGDSAVENIGLAPAKLETLEAYIRTVRALLEEGRASWQGRDVKLNWVKRRIPIGMPASGPRALRMAGRLADIVLVVSGIDERTVAQAYELIEQGARESGRTLDDLEIWWGALLDVGDSHESSVERLKYGLVRYAYLVFRYTLEGKAVPESLADGVRRFVESYQSHHHGAVDANTDLAKQLGLDEFLAERLAIAGPVDQCVERIRAVGRHGVDRLWFPIVAGKTDPFIKGLQELMAGLGDQATLNR